MTGGFAADVLEIQKYAQDWNEQAQQVEKLPAQLSTIESRLAAVLENTFAADALNVLVGGTQLGVWFDLRSKLSAVAGNIGTLARQLAQDSQTLRRCSIEYQLADQAAADGFSDVYVFCDFQSYDSPVSSLLRTLSAGDERQAVSAAGELIADSPGSVSKRTTDTGPAFQPWAQSSLDGAASNSGNAAPKPQPGAEFGAGGGEGATTTDS